MHPGRGPQLTYTRPRSRVVTVAEGVGGAGGVPSEESNFTMVRGGWCGVRRGSGPREGGGVNRCCQPQAVSGGRNCDKAVHRPGGSQNPLGGSVPAPTRAGGVGCNLRSTPNRAPRRAPLLAGNRRCSGRARILRAYILCPTQIALARTRGPAGLPPKSVKRPRAASKKVLLPWWGGNRDNHAVS